MNDLQKGWVAGFLDGDGSIMRDGRLSVTNESMNLLTHLQNLIGGTILKHSIQKQNGKQVYRLRLSAVKTEMLLAELDDIIVEKKLPRGTSKAGKK